MKRVLKRRTSLVSVFVSCILLCSILVMASNPTPMNLDSIEAKFMLDPTKVVKDGTTEPTQDLVDWLNITESTDMIVAYIDTESKLLNADGWSNRLRKKEGKSNYELQYKKRYPVTDGNIDEALKLAAKDGFINGLGEYTAELDWGYNKMTLSIATKIKIKTTKDLMLPVQSEGVKLIADNKVNELFDYTYDEARYYGPIECTRYTGSFMGTELDIEIWPIISKDGQGTDIIAEVSFTGEDIEDVTAIRAELNTFLESKGIMLRQDSLKTQTILDRY